MYFTNTLHFTEFLRRLIYPHRNAKKHPLGLTQSFTSNVHLAYPTCLMGNAKKNTPCLTKKTSCFARNYLSNPEQTGLFAPHCWQGMFFRTNPEYIGYQLFPMMKTPQSNRFCVDQQTHGPFPNSTMRKWFLEKSSCFPPQTVLTQVQKTL